MCEDAALEQAVHAALAGCYVNCGQNCVASERILVHDRLYDAFEKRAAELVGAFKQGSSRDGVVDVGAIITPLQLDIIERAVLFFEARIDLNFIDLDTGQIEQGILNILVDYTVRATNTRSNMVYPFYFQEGTNIQM